MNENWSLCVRSVKSFHMTRGSSLHSVNMLKGKCVFRQHLKPVRKEKHHYCLISLNGVGTDRNKQLWENETTR